MSAAVVVLVAAWFIPLDPKRLQAVAAVATALAAIVALTSAVNSSRAAASSERAASDAIRALSYASKPEIRLHLHNKDGDAIVAVENVAPQPVAELKLQWSDASGMQDTKFLPGINAMPLTSEGMMFGTRGEIVSHNIGASIDLQFPVQVTAWYAGRTGPTAWSVQWTFGGDVATERNVWGEFLYPVEHVRGDAESRSPFLR